MATLNLVITEKNDLLFQGIADPSQNADFSLTDLDGEGGDPFAVACGLSWEIVSFLEGVEYDSEDRDTWWSAREKIIDSLVGNESTEAKELAKKVFDSHPKESVQAVLGDADDETGVSYESGQLVDLSPVAGDFAVYVDDSEGYFFINPKGLSCVDHDSLVEEFDSSSNSCYYRTTADATNTSDDERK